MKTKQFSFQVIIFSLSISFCAIAQVYASQVHRDNLLLASGSKNSSLNTQKGSSKKPYEVKSGYMKMESNMGLTRQIWFDEYGNKQREEVSLEMAGFKQGAVIITRDGFKYEYAIGSDKGNKRAISENNLLNYNNPTPEDIERYGIKKIGSEKVAGKDCIVYSTEKPTKSKVWIWKGINMKSSSAVSGNSITLEVIEIREEKVDQSKFQIPEGIKFTEM